MNILKILLPNILPIAKSTEPILTAATETTTSGKEEVNAIKMFPTKASPKPVEVAIYSPILGRKIAAIITKSAFTTYFEAASRIEISVYLSASANWCKCFFICFFSYELIVFKAKK